MNMRETKLIAGIVLAASLVVTASAQTTVYDNTATNNYKGQSVGLANLPSGTVEFGDEITLAPGARRLADLKIDVYGVGLSGTESVTLNLWQNIGTFQSPNFQSIGTGTALLKAQTWQTVDYQDASLTLPDTFIWSVSFSGVTGTKLAELPIYDPPTVGGALNGGEIGSYKDFWVRNSSGAWSLFNLSDGTPGNFAALVTAVPEAGTIAYGLVGGLMVLGYLRLRRSK
jgi:hypothetical protein